MIPALSATVLPLLFVKLLADSQMCCISIKCVRKKSKTIRSRQGQAQDLEMNQLDLLLAHSLLKPFFDIVLLEHGELSHVLPLAVHLDFLVGV